MAMTSSNKGRCLHIGYNVIQPETDETEDGPPDANYFGGEVSALSAEETGKADHPVAANASEEDLVPMWDDLFLSCVRNCFLLEICRVKNSSV
jgi:hypothetical protein